MNRLRRSVVDRLMQNAQYELSTQPVSTLQNFARGWLSPPSWYLRRTATKGVSTEKCCMAIELKQAEDSKCNRSFPQSIKRVGSPSKNNNDRKSIRVGQTAY